MNLKELMANKEIAGWVRTLLTAVVICFTAGAGLTSWQAKVSFDSLKAEVKTGNDQQQKWNAKIDAAIALHEQRIISMEANRFTRVDGEQMQLRISENLKSIAVLQTDQAYIKNTVSSMNEKIDRLLERRTAP